MSKGNICPCCQKQTLHETKIKRVRVFECKCGFKGHSF